MPESSLRATIKFVRKFLVYFLIFILIVLIIDWIAGILTSQAENNAINNPERTQNLNKRLQSNDEFQESLAKFGEITKPNLRNIPLKNPENINFIVRDTLPDFDKRYVPIYEIVPNQSIESQSYAEELANNLNLNTAPSNNSNDNSLRWERGSRTLNYNLTQNSFEYFNGSVFPDNSEDKEVPTNLATIASQSEDLISELGINKKNLSINSVEIDYLLRRGNIFVSADDANDAEYVKLRIYRAVSTDPVEVLQIESERLKQYEEIGNEVVKSQGVVHLDDYYTAPVEIILAVGDPTISLDNLFSLKYYTWEFSGEVGNYEIIPPTEAWEKIKNGEGAFKKILRDGENDYQFGRLENREVIELIADPDNIEFAYLEPINWSESSYLIPIYIFTGRAKLADSPSSTNASFTAYVYAI